MKTVKKTIILLIMFIVLCNKSFSQTADTTKIQDTTHINSDSSVIKKKTFIDPLDGAFDLSRFVLELHGFVPIPDIITEPALGHFGLALGAVFMSPIKVDPEAAKKNKHYSPKFPNTLAAGAMYTLNDSWGAFGGYIGSFDKINSEFRLGTGYMNINMDFYYTSKITNEEHKMLLNLEAIPAYGRFGFDFLGYFDGGLSYLFMNTTVSPEDIDIPFLKELLDNKKWKSNVSRLSLFLTFDSRDNVFTPNDGIKIDTKYDISDEIIGSDFDYTQMNAAFYGYKTILDGWVGGLRIDYQQAFGEPPFYLLPYINSRGIPTARYQSNITLLAETEHRVRIYKRWSGIGFVGLGKAFETFDDFGDSKLVYYYGAGFRYLIARLLNLHMGVDFGFGPDNSKAFYIVFGSSWIR